jgi:hypothetical protein
VPQGVPIIRTGRCSSKGQTHSISYGNFCLRRLWGEGGIWQPKGFGGLEPLSDKGYSLWYTTDYREGLGELDFSVVFPSMWACPTTDYRVENLLISIGFKRTPTRQIRSRFVAAMEHWFRSVSQHGVFGEGPIKPVLAQLDFRGRLVQFRIDVTQSGQDTLNWLLLSALNFGYEVSAVSDFMFDHEKQVQSFLDFPIPNKVESLQLHLA